MSTETLSVFPPPLARLLPALTRWGWIGGCAGALGALALLAAGWVALGRPAAGPGVLLHPIAAVGHGIAVALVCLLVQGALAHHAARAGLDIFRQVPSGPSWAAAARQRCIDAAVAPLPDLRRQKYDECRRRWEEELRRRRTYAYVGAAALVWPSAVLVLWLLTPELAQATYAAELALAVLVAGFEALVVTMALLLQGSRWENLLLRWKDEAAALDTEEWQQRALAEQAAVQRPPDQPGSRNGSPAGSGQAAGAPPESTAIGQTGSHGAPAEEPKPPELVPPAGPQWVEKPREDGD